MVIFKICSQLFTVTIVALYEVMRMQVERLWFKPSRQPPSATLLMSPRVKQRTSTSSREAFFFVAACAPP